ncbi:Tyrosine-protein phosphatase non-receptor type 1 [Neolecta irregularis DAH-3]|uniref:protein-tyrosine-phosphatase n=1 Tax=Neolecta irregularis (strain DAH-3) TaxID=1198029 RepID=A0A1U7LTC8_NEOID|nr:Tyrosine-protein phosphatase non-receptor type 1 [Neolecta irregularis DAH-3]|eukprot:OLL25868.1 Tyrosine-protein phosphatase non-receptor type 1 [Neolecta irregularis DAH-3]
MDVALHNAAPSFSYFDLAGECNDHSSRPPSAEDPCSRQSPVVEPPPQAARRVSIRSPIFAPGPTPVFSLASTPTPAFSPALAPTPVSLLPLQPADLRVLLRCSREPLLILDVRLHSAYEDARIASAVHISVPSTLLKRPSFTLARISDSIPDTGQRSKFTSYKRARLIVIYDADCANITDSWPGKQLAKKFATESCDSQALRVFYLKGGFKTFSSVNRDLIDTLPISSSTSASSLSLPSRPTLTLQCQIPKNSSPICPFFTNIRQNTELANGVGDPIPLRLNNLSDSIKSALPNWLKRIACSPSGPQKLAESFYGIEKTEQKRLQKALNPNIVDGFSISAGLERGNKNRYNNIWPYDHSRVKLVKDGDDYVNASFCHALDGKNRYIATQGPLPSTFEDFWRIVWDQRVWVIVMLTTIEEAGQIKCHNYWNDEKMGCFIIRNISTNIVANGTIICRRFSLSHTDYPFTSIREVTHLQYTEWPDFGVPVAPSSLLSLIHEANIASTTTSPMLVHCSAGCGRTGAFCTVDTVLSMLRDSTNNEEDLILKTVLELREKRISMVQTLRQFVLCYEAVIEAFIRQAE